MKKFILIFMVFALLISCKKNDIPESNNKPLTGKVKGQIVFPQGSPINSNSLEVFSLVEESRVLNGAYEIGNHSVNSYSSLLLLDSNNEIIMMSYNYPGMQNYDISPQSTALAMLMNTPIIQSLTEQGKLNLINKIKQNSSFEKLTNEITKALLKGKYVTDSTNINLKNAFQNLFTSAVNMNKQNEGSPQELIENPFTFYRSGRQIIIVNNGIACSYVIGVYKDGQRTGPLIKIKGVEPFASSLPELLKGVFSTPSVIEQTINLVGDGKFEIKIRSGKIIDHTIESDSALYINQEEFVFAGTKMMFSLVDDNCLNAIQLNLAPVIRSLNRVSIPQSFDLETAGTYFHEILTTTLSSARDITKDCAKIEFDIKDNKFFQGMLKYLKFLDIVGKAGGAMNTTAMVYHFALAKPKIDTCFIATGNVIKSCDRFKIPDLSTVSISSITSNSATSGGIITDDGSQEITAKGVCWSTSQNPTIANNKTNEGTGSSAFTSNLAGLLENTTYYARAYATNSVGTAYGNEINFKTSYTDTITYTAHYWVPGTITNNTITLKLHFNGSTITGRGLITNYPIWGTVTGYFSGTNMTLNFNYDNGVTPKCNFIQQPPPSCPVCVLQTFLGGNIGVKEAWVIAGTTNNSHSSFTATYVRNYTTKQIVGQDDCTFPIVIDHAEENGNFTY